MVKSIVSGFYVPRGLERDDLLQAGMIGVWKAVEKYDSTEDAEFSTYAYVSARNEVMMLIRQYSRYQEEQPLLIEERVPQEGYEVESEVVHRMIKEDLEKQDKKLVQLLHEGYTQQEIANLYKTTQPRVCQRVRQLRIKGKRKWGGFL